MSTTVEKSFVSLEKDTTFALRFRKKRVILTP